MTAVLSHTDQRVCAVASRNLERAKRFSSRFGIERAYGSYDQLLSDPQIDVIYIAAPHSEHATLALAAVQAGKHVLVEKPFATNPADAAIVIAAAREAKVFAMEALWTAFLPQTSIVDALVSEGIIGEVHHATADFGVHTPYEPSSRTFDPQLGGGAMLDLGVYASWFILNMLGPANSVRATGELSPTGVDFEALVVTRHEHGAIGAAFSSLRSRTPHRAVVSGTLGSIEVGTPFWGPSGVTLRSGGQSVGWRDRSGITGRDGLAYQVAAAAAYISSGLFEAPTHPLSASIELLTLITSAANHLRG